MIKSMTGYGRSKQLIDGYEISAEIKSVNHRYFDCTIKLPKYYGFLEDKIRETAKNYLTRGKIEIYLYIKKKEEDEREISVNKALCDNYVRVLSKLRSDYGISEEITLSTLTRFSDIFEIENKELDEEKITALTLTVLEAALVDIVAMRKREGERIKADLDARLVRIGELADAVDERFPQIVQDYENRLIEKLKSILNNVEEQRIITEAAIFADKITTREETVRLKSHIKEFGALLNKEGAVGKKLDFIVQEMNRESNTIGSKANDLETSKMVVALKSEVENIREQVQNIE
mgnify:FL=1